MKWVLVGRDGDFSDAEFSIEQTLSIGREDHNDIVIKNDYVSRNHARLSVQGDDLYIDDLNSTGGLRVNGQKTGQAKLSHDDKIQIEDFVFQVRDESRAVDLGQTLVRAPEDINATIVRPLVAEPEVNEDANVDASKLNQLQDNEQHQAQGEVKEDEDVVEGEEAAEQPLLPDDAKDIASENPAPEQLDNSTVIMPSEKQEIPNKTMEWTPSEVAEGGTVVMSRDGMEAAMQPKAQATEEKVAILRGESDPIKDKDFSLSRNKITIGRSTLNHISVQSTVLSANHAEIVKEGDDWVIHDLGSANGTFVNGVQVLSSEHTGDGRVVRLQTNDRIKLGNVELVFNPTGTKPVSGRTAAQQQVATKRRSTALLERIDLSDPNRTLLLVASIVILLILVLVLGGVLLFGGDASDTSTAKGKGKVGSLVQTSQWQLSIGQFGAYSDLVVANVNGDSEPEILTLDQAGALHIFSSVDGSSKYSSPATGPHSHPPLTAQLDGDADLEVVTVSEAGVIRAYDGNAQTIWQQALSAGSVFAPASLMQNSTGQVLLVPTQSKGVVAIDLLNRGRELWNTQRLNQGSLVAAPLLVSQDGDAVFNLDFDGRGTLFKFSGSEVAWEISLPGKYIATPSIVYSNNRSLVITASLSGLISAIEVGEKAAKIVWQQQLANVETVTADPVAIGAFLIIADSSGQLFVLDPVSGAQLRTEQAGRAPVLEKASNASYELLAVKSGNNVVLYNDVFERVADIRIPTGNSSNSAPALAGAEDKIQLIDIDNNGYVSAVTLEL